MNRKQFLAVIGAVIAAPFIKKKKKPLITWMTFSGPAEIREAQERAYQNLIAKYPEYEHKNMTYYKAGGGGSEYTTVQAWGQCESKGKG